MSSNLYQADSFSPTERFIDFLEVQKYIPLSKSRYYALMRQKRVPCSVKIADHRACWLLSEVLAYAEARIQERNEKIQEVILQTNNICIIPYHVVSAGIF